MDHKLTEGQRQAAYTGPRTILIYTAVPHPLSALQPEGFTNATNIKDRTAWIVNNLQRLDQHHPVQGPSEEDQPQDMDTGEPGEGLTPDPSATSAEHPPADLLTLANIPRRTGQTGAPRTTRAENNRTVQARSDTGTSPERKAHSAPAPAVHGKKPSNRFSPLLNLRDIEEQESEGLYAGSTSEAGSSRSSRPRDFIPITAEILLLLDRLEPDKIKQAKYLSEHIAGHRALPTTEEELQAILDKRTRRAIEREQAAAESSRAAAERALAEAAEQRRVNETVISDYAEQARDAALAAGKSQEEEAAAYHKAAAETRTVVEAATARTHQ
jgi:hypothetical protein